MKRTDIDSHMNPLIRRAYARQRAISYQQWVRKRDEQWIQETALCAGLIFVALLLVGVLRGGFISLTIGYPQLLVCILFIVALVVSIVSHGKPKKGIHNAGDSILAIVIEVAILYWGGFFS